MHDSLQMFKDIIDSMKKAVEGADSVHLYVKVSEGQIVPLKAVQYGRLLKDNDAAVVVFCAIDQDDSELEWDQIVDVRNIVK